MKINKFRKHALYYQLEPVVWNGRDVPILSTWVCVTDTDQKGRPWCDAVERPYVFSYLAFSMGKNWHASSVMQRFPSYVRADAKMKTPEELRTLMEAMLHREVLSDTARDERTDATVQPGPAAPLDRLRQETHDSRGDCGRFIEGDLYYEAGFYAWRGEIGSFIVKTLLCQRVAAGSCVRDVMWDFVWILSRERRMEQFGPSIMYEYSSSLKVWEDFCAAMPSFFESAERLRRDKVW